MNMLYRGHWILLAINIDRNLIYFMDPLDGDHSNRLDMKNVVETYVILSLPLLPFFYIFLLYYIHYYYCKVFYNLISSALRTVSMRAGRRHTSIDWIKIKVCNVIVFYLGVANSS